MRRIRTHIGLSWSDWKEISIYINRHTQSLAHWFVMASCRGRHCALAVWRLRTVFPSKQHQSLPLEKQFFSLHGGQRLTIFTTERVLQKLLQLEMMPLQQSAGFVSRQKITRWNQTDTRDAGLRSWYQELFGSSNGNVVKWLSYIKLSHQTNDMHGTNLPRCGRVSVTN